MWLTRASVIAVLGMALAFPMTLVLAQGGGGHAGGGGPMGGGSGRQGSAHGFGPGGRSSPLRLHGGGDAHGFGFGDGRRGGSGFGQNGDGLSDYAPYGRPVTGCDLTTPSRAHPGC